MHDDQVAQEFHEQGFVALPGVINDGELAALREEAAAQLDAGPGREPPGDFPFKDGHWWRVNSMITKPLANRSVLAVLAHPAIQHAVHGILGVPVFGDDALVFKSKDGGAAVQIHSSHRDNDGASWSPERDVVNVGIYLDDATPETGCLRVAPGSHKLPAKEALALAALNHDMPGLVDVPMRAGDVLIHNEWVLHGSQATPPGDAKRRVQYLAFGRLSSWMRNREHGALMLRRLAYAHDYRRTLPYAAGEAPSPFSIPADWEADVAAVADDELAAVAPVAGGVKSA